MMSRKIFFTSCACVFLKWLKMAKILISAFGLCVKTCFLMELTGRLARLKESYDTFDQFGTTMYVLQ
jgi:hypothetical protein